MSIEILTLLITILGWAATYHYQTRILERQLRAERDIKSLELTNQLALSGRQLKLDILPLAREKMLEAHGQIAYLARRNIDYPDFSNWSELQLEDWVKSLEFTAYQKASLMMAHDKVKYYLQTQFAYDAKKAQKSLDDFHNFLIFKKPFIDAELFEEFGAVENFFRQTLNGITIARRSHDHSLEMQFVTDFEEKVTPMLEKIEVMIIEQIDKNFPVTLK